MPKVPKVKNLKAKSRGWIFVINNYNADEVLEVQQYAENCVYLIYGLEAGDSGTPHIQAYLYFKSACYFSRMKKAFPRAHIEAAQGTPAQNRSYCIKEGDWQEFGTIPQKGKRCDITDFVRKVKDSDSKLPEEELLLSHAALVARYPLFVDRVQRFFHPPKARGELDNYWLCGPPGTGKTVRAKAMGSYFIKAPNKWFDGYLGEDVLIVEDLEPQHSRTMSWFLKIWGDYDPVTAQVKGSSLFIRPDILCVTSNYTIDEMGWDESTTLAMKRRFKETFYSEQFSYPKDCEESSITSSPKV